MSKRSLLSEQVSLSNIQRITFDDEKRYREPSYFCWDKIRVSTKGIYHTVARKKVLLILQYVS